MAARCDECGERVTEASQPVLREFTDGRLEPIATDGRAHLKPCGHYSTYTVTPESPTYPQR